MKTKFNFKNMTLIVIFITIIITLLCTKKYWIQYTNLKDFVSFIKSYGKYAIIPFILIFSLKPFAIFIPAAMLSIAGGILFGPVKGFIINMIGFFISGTLAFYLSRSLGKNFVDKMLKGKALALNNNMGKKGFKILFLLRLPPVLPYDPLSYACGLTKISYSAFILASLLGVIPETLCYSLMGESILSPFSAKFILPLIFIIIATVLSGFAFKKSREIN
ncbi:TVP38/TMEM64 family protein [Hathewaya histolytica]|uniref:TVP38/TMEM64 family membrane protein n=1 Tax=Hathewaya histolytica TaxID=1498 RepID=A0A4U9RF56_HATHI|nr:TVP38/TMEM64 family protein [Hathewaya histolytica]VTQ90492.1 DedA family protein [Hathewaya histolytica]